MQDDLKKLTIRWSHKAPYAVGEDGTEYSIPRAVVNTISRCYHGATIIAKTRPNDTPGKPDIVCEVMS